MNPENPENPEDLVDLVDLVDLADQVDRTIPGTQMKRNRLNRSIPRMTSTKNTMLQ